MLKMQVTKILVLQIITGGSAGIGLLFILAAIFGFNSKSYYHDDKIGIQFGMKVDIETQESFVWARVPGALYIKSSLYNIYKVEKDGSKTEKDFSSLMPIARGVHGGMDAKFQIFEAISNEFPDLDSRNQEVVPMGYISQDSSLVAFFRYFLMIGAIFLRHWTFWNVLAVLNAVGSIILGIALLYRTHQKKKRIVTDMKEIDPPGPSVVTKLQMMFSKYRAGSGS